MREDWKEIKMVDACEILTCGVASTPKYVDENVGVPFLSAQNVRNGEIVLDKYKHISQEFHEHLTKKNKPQKGDILYSRVGAKYGEAGVVEHDFEFSVYVSVTLMRPKPELFNNYYFKYYLNSPRIKELAKRSIQSSGVPNLNVKVVREFPVPIPPLEEQKQIVSLLDKSFTAIDQAKTNIEKNIENAKELFQSKLNDIFSQKGDGWEEKTLGEMSKIMYGYTSKVIADGNVQYVRITDIQDGNVVWNTVPFVNISEEEKPKYKLSKGDIVFARTGATTGKSYLMQNPPNSVFASYLIRVQCDTSILIPSFLYLYFQSGIYWQIVESGKSGSAQGGFNASKLGAMKIHFPKNKNQQLEYVNLIESIRIPIEEMIINYQIKLNDLEELKKSILQKAFVGELTENAVIV